MSKYVLVVEDNPSDLMISSAMVESMGLVPITATNGIEALDQLGEYEFQLFIVDLQMPKMGGIDLIKRIKKIEEVKTVPIIVTSARKESKDVKGAVLAGAQDYLVKPLDKQVFAEKLKKTIGNTEEAWKEYSLNPEFFDSLGYMKKRINILSLSEVSMALETSEQVEEGQNMEFFADILEAQGVGTLAGSVKSCEKTETGYKVKLSFIGMTEETRKKIRVLCRNLWQKEKQTS